MTLYWLKRLGAGKNVVLYQYANFPKSAEQFHPCTIWSVTSVLGRVGEGGGGGQCTRVGVVHHSYTHSVRGHGGLTVGSLSVEHDPTRGGPGDNVCCRVAGMPVGQHRRARLHASQPPTEVPQGDVRLPIPPPLHSRKACTGGGGGCLVNLAVLNLAEARDKG